MILKANFIIIKWRWKYTSKIIAIKACKNNPVLKIYPNNNNRNKMNK